MQPPLILAIDTSGPYLGCVLTKGSSLQKQLVDKTTNDHCKNIVLIVEKILHEENITLQEIDAFACIKGPGSFTGLRIGMMMMKTFSHTFQKPLIGINTFERMVQKNHQKNVCYLWPAQKDHVYLTTSPLEDTSQIEFGPTSTLLADHQTLYGPEHMLETSKDIMRLPFETICGTSMAGRLFEHWTKRTFLETNTCEPLYVQHVKAQKIQS